MSKRTIPISTRGLLSTIVYDKLYRQELSDDKILKMIDDNKNTLVVLLKADIDDLEIRFKANNEPKIDIQTNIDMFDTYADFICARGVMVIVCNTSEMTPYMIAKEVMKIIETEE